MSALKLYRFSDAKNEYWETWQDGDGSYTIHWGELGTQGKSKTIKSGFFRDAKRDVSREADEMLSQGFAPYENHATLMIEYAVDGMGSDEEEKRYRLQERMDETLGWTGLGHCDGGSIGSGTMEVCTFVVDFALAKAVIENDLAETEFSNFTRIYNEGGE